MTTSEYLMSLLNKPTPPAVTSNKNLEHWLIRQKQVPEPQYRSPSNWITGPKPTNSINTPSIPIRGGDQVNNSITPPVPALGTQPVSSGTLNAEKLKQLYLDELEKHQDRRQAAGQCISTKIHNNWDKPESIDSDFESVAELDDAEPEIMKAYQYATDIASNGKNGYNIRGENNWGLSKISSTYSNDVPISYSNPIVNAAYKIGGLDSAPTFEHDPGFPYDPNEEATQDDKNSWMEWGVIAWLSGLNPWLQDAAKMYKHYRDNTGTPIEIDFERAYKDDETIKSGIDNEILRMQNFVNSSYAGGEGTSFEIIGNIVRIPNGATENWQKTIGAFQTFGYGKVTINPKTGIATMVVTFYLEDTYNFNPGQADIASGTPDAVNGRFSQLGWAKEFKTYGSLTKTITWNISDTNIPSTQEGDSR